ncbi:hypothetical protein K1719_021754 [Acacia pycnantha]|nr:hypothetical protein K1719_021754 [Acacia pycnantha]
MVRDEKRKRPQPKLNITSDATSSTSVFSSFGLCNKFLSQGQGTLAGKIEGKPASNRYNPEERLNMYSIFNILL